MIGDLLWNGLYGDFKIFNSIIVKIYTYGLGTTKFFEILFDKQMLSSTVTLIEKWWLAQLKELGVAFLIMPLQSEW